MGKTSCVLRKLLIALAIAGGAFFLASLVFSFKEATLLGLILFFVTLWTNEGFPIGVTSLLPIVLFPAFDILGTNATSMNYSKSIVFLFLGGFMIAIAVEKTGLHKIIAHKIMSIFPSTLRGMIFALTITSGILSSFLSNTTTALLLMPLALFLSENPKIKIRLALAIAYGASVGGIMTPIGTPPNLILMGILEQHNIETIPFFQWINMVAPISIIMFIVVGYVLSFGMEKVFIIQNEIKPKMSNDQKKVSFAIIGLIVMLFLNSPIQPYYDGLGLNEKGILLSFGLLMFTPVFNILQWEDSKKIPFEIIFLFGAGFSIATAFTSTGLAQSIANYLLEITSLPPFLLILAISSLIALTSEITSNTALVSMMLPVVYEITVAGGLDIRLFMMVATISASYVFMLPIATPPNAIAMASGVMKVGDMAKFGFILNIVGILLVSTVAYFFW